MTTAYGSIDIGTKPVAQFTGKRYAEKLSYIPIYANLRDETQVCLDFPHTHADAEAVRHMFNERITEGDSWPFLEPLDEQQFLEYFFAHTALVVRIRNTGDIIGAFYVKPNFPGRCTHYCNGGFITDTPWRRKGLATIMGRTYLRVARDLGFKASIFNLVFVSNVPSVRLWEKLGFSKIALLPKVARLKGSKTEFIDAYQFYYDLTSMTQKDLSRLILNDPAKLGDANRMKRQREDALVRAVHVNVSGEGDTNFIDLRSQIARGNQRDSGNSSGQNPAEQNTPQQNPPQQNSKGFSFQCFNLSSLPRTVLLILGAVGLFLAGRASAPGVNLNSISSVSSPSNLASPSTLTSSHM